MPEMLETTVDKFTFQVAADRFYTEQGVWAKPEGGRVRVGVSDFLQQSNGDVAFAEVQPEGTRLARGDEIAVLETIKVDLELASPVEGVLAEINPQMDDAPETINSDPYGEGWIALVEPDDWEADRALLLDPQAYFTHMKQQAEEEAGK